MKERGRWAHRAGLWALFAVVMAFATGCTASSDYMRATLTPLDAPPPPGYASVVFVRPTGYASSVLMTVLDDQGRFIGDATAESCFVTPVPAGKHLFVGWAENTAALQADLAPGRVYFVQVSPRFGWLSARVQLLAITPQSERWKDLQEWVSNCDKFRPDEAAGQAYLNGRRDAASERVRRAKEALAGYDAEELRDRTITPPDGVAPTPYGPPPGAVALPPLGSLPPPPPAPPK